MAMIESVAVRQRGALDFDAYYCNLCALQNSCPLPAVKAHIQEKVLDLNADRIRSTDWNPILGAIKINKTLEIIAIRSYYQQTVEEQEKRGYTVKRKIPAIRSKEITYRLCKVLKECLAVSTTIKCIELQGLPLRHRDLAGLAKGLMANQSLRQLSLGYSRIGDEGLEILCKGIKNAPAVSILDFTGCSLTPKGTDHLAKLIKACLYSLFTIVWNNLYESSIEFGLGFHRLTDPSLLTGDIRANGRWSYFKVTLKEHQAMKRHNEAWQDSLRYRRPELDRMDGIRRLSINRNNMLGDDGAILLAEALKDDLWLKALDLQHCGISDVGAKYLLDVLKYNTCLVILDVRNNPMIGQELVRNMMEHLMINSNGQDTQYQWLKSEVLQDPTKFKQKKKRTKTLQSSFGRKTTIKVNSNARKRTKSAGTPSRTIAPIAEGVTTPGIPWRTALRANRYKGYPPDDSPSRQYDTEDGRPPAVYKIDYSYEDDDDDDRATEDTAKAVGIASDPDDTDITDPRGVRVEIERLRRRAKDETKARSRAEERVIELTVENNRLKQRIDDYQCKQSILDDDRVLESLEQSFQQFHSFLDLLRDAGLGQLITLAGIDQSTMPFSKEAPSIRSSMKNLSTNGHVTAHKSQSQVYIQDQGYQQSAPDLSNQEQAHRARPVKPSSKSTSDPTINRGAKVVFPQIQPQNYQNISDPTMQVPVANINANGKTKSRSKFDELYEKVLQETEGALSDSLTKAEDKSDHSHNGYHNNRSRERVVVGGAGGDVSDVSERSHRSGGSSNAVAGGGGRPLLIEDLHDINDLEQLRTSTDHTTQIKVGGVSGGVGGSDAGDFNTPRETDHTGGKYTETFEKDEESEISEIIEDFDKGGNSDEEDF